MVVDHDHRQHHAGDGLQVHAGDDVVGDAGGVAVDQLVQRVEVRDVLVIPVGVVGLVVPSLRRAGIAEKVKPAGFSRAMSSSLDLVIIAARGRR